MGLRRDLYLAQRLLGDGKAAKRGTLGKRVARRTVTRNLLKPYGRLWR
jgi:hypothetical protein